MSIILQTKLNEINRLLDTVTYGDYNDIFQKIKDCCILKLKYDEFYPYYDEFYILLDSVKNLISMEILYENDDTLDVYDQFNHMCEKIKSVENVTILKNNIDKHIKRIIIFFDIFKYIDDNKEIITDKNLIFSLIPQINLKMFTNKYISKYKIEKYSYDLIDIIDFDSGFFDEYNFDDHNLKNKLHDAIMEVGSTKIIFFKIMTIITEIFMKITKYYKIYNVIYHENNLKYEKFHEYIKKYFTIGKFPETYTLKSNINISSINEILNENTSSNNIERKFIKHAFISAHYIILFEKLEVLNDNIHSKISCYKSLV